MGGIKDTTPPQMTADAGTFVTRNRITKGFISFTASFQETLRYVKAFFVGWGKRITAKTEAEAARADLLTAKMQVEATEAAESKKGRLNQSV